MEVEENQHETQVESFEKTFPPEVVRKIVNFLPKKDLKKIALVSKFFHRVVCELEQFKYPLVVTHDTIHNSASSAYVQTKRQFNKLIINNIQLNDENLKFVSSLMEIHGPKILTLRISCEEYPGGEIRANEWINLLMLVPNLVNFMLYVKDMKISHWKNHTGILQNLRNLSLGLKASEIGDFFKYIRPDSIEKFSIHSEWDDLNDFLCRQRGIKDLTITKRHLVNYNFFQKLSLDRLNIHVPSQDTILEGSDLLSMIKQHPELKNFDFLNNNGKPIELEMSGELLEALCNLERLQNLSIRFTTDNLAHINSLTRCKAEEISLDLYSLELHEINTLKLEKLKKLSIMFGMDFFEEKLRQILFQQTNLRYLRLNFNCDYMEEIEILPLNTILEPCLRLEHLILEDEGILLEYSYHYNGLEYSNMKELEIDRMTFRHGFAELLDAMPNLEKLKAKRSLDFSVLYLRSLANMKKLKVCKLWFTFGSTEIVVTTEVKSILKKLFNNIETLKVKLHGASEKVSEEILEEFPQDKYPGSIKHEDDILTLKNF